MSKYFLPLGFVAVGLFCIYPWILGKGLVNDYKLISGFICLTFGVGSLIYDLTKRK